MYLTINVVEYNGVIIDGNSCWNVKSIGSKFRKSYGDVDEGGLELGHIQAATVGVPIHHVGGILTFRIVSFKGNFVLRFHWFCRIKATGVNKQQQHLIAI